MYCTSKALQEIRINSAMPFLNELSMGDIFGGMTFLFHIMYRYITIKLGNVRTKGNRRYVLLKVTFSIGSIQEGEQGVEADSKGAAAIPTTERTLHYLWLYYSLSHVSLFMQLLVLSVMEILHQIIIIKPVIM